MGSSMTPTVELHRLLTHLRALEGERHPVTTMGRLLQAQSYVAEQLSALGLLVRLDPVDYEGVTGANVIATQRRPSGQAALLIGAHIDTAQGTPGADDNASGVAALLEAARVLTSAHPDVPVEFVGFAFEELGMQGSRHHARQLKLARRRLLGMLSLEMVGFTESEGLQQYPPLLRPWFPETGNYLALVGNIRSRRLLADVGRAMRSVPDLPIEQLMLPGNGGLIPESRLSDHAPFWDAGFPALLVTDTAFLRNPHYHAASDTIDTLDLPFLARVCQGVVATALACAR